MAAVLLMSPVSAVQAKSPVSAASSAVEETQFRNLAADLPYEWSEEPEASRPDVGYKLTDGKYGTLDMNDPAWVGHLRGKTREVVFDLGEEKSVGKITAHFFQDYPTNSILVPLTVSMYVSDDKENWGLLSHNATQLLWGEGPPRQETFEWDGSRDGIKGGYADGKLAYARYVKVTFTMHPSQWSYIDEIEIIGTDDMVEGAVKVSAEQPRFLEPGEATAGIRNLNLLYNGQYADGLGDWSKERIIPNMAELVRGYVASNEINAAFGDELSYRLQIIKLLLDENKPKDAVTYMQDFLAHIHDPAVQAQGLISASAATLLDTYAQVLIQTWSEGWGLSNLAQGLSYTISRPPNSSYPDSGNELTNGLFGGTDFRNEQWQGHAGSAYPEERSRTITFDLGRNKSIGVVRAHFLQDQGPGIYAIMHSNSNKSHGSSVTFTL